MLKNLSYSSKCEHLFHLLGEGEHNGCLWCVNFENFSSVKASLLDNSPNSGCPIEDDLYVLGDDALIS